MTGLNLEKIYAKFREIADSVARLKAFGDVSLEDFLDDRDKQDIASFRLIVATEAAIDICLHVAAKVIKKVPEEYAGCFMLLSEHGLIDQNLATRLAQMARFRNRLVHLYWDVDIDEVWKITQTRLNDFEKYISQIGKFLSLSI